MELILAIVLAGPLGYLVKSRRRSLGLYLAAWAVVLPLQTLVVHAENPGDINAAYPFVNATILALGIALNRLGARLSVRTPGARSRPSTDRAAGS
jgi:hypothetical protein